MNQVLKILAMFILTQLLGLFVGIQMVGSPEFSSLNVTPTQQSGDITNSLIFLVYVIVGALFVVLLIRFYRGVVLFKVMESVILFISSNIVFEVLLNALQAPYPSDVLLAFFLSVALIGAKYVYPQVRNFAAIIASAGVGAIFGFSLDLMPAIVLIAGLSVYDFISVFWTKHMVYMAKELSKKNLSFSISAKEKHYVPELKKEEESSLELGTGDMAIPLMLAVSAYKLGAPGFFYSGILYSLATIAGSSLGLIFVLIYVTRRRVFLPALPPLAFFSLVALGVAKLLLG